MSLLSIIRILEHDIELHEYYKDIMIRKYARNPLPRYRCELNKLNRLLVEKHGELKERKLQHDITSIRKIFYSKKYISKAESTYDRNNDRPNKDKNRENIYYRDALATKILNNKKHRSKLLGECPLTQSTPSEIIETGSTSKIFYSEKYRAKFNGSCTENVNEDKSSQLGNAQFEKFKNMYMKWVKVK